MGPEDIVRTYFARMRAGDSTVVDLFSDSAQLIGLGNRVVGKAAIGEWYAYAQQEGGAVPEVLAMACDAHRVFAEILIRVSDGSTVHVVDRFDVADGRIETLTYFVADYPAEAAHGPRP